MPATGYHTISIPRDSEIDTIIEQLRENAAMENRALGKHTAIIIEIGLRYYYEDMIARARNKTTPDENPG